MLPSRVLGMAPAARLTVQSTTAWQGSESSTRLYGVRWRKERVEFLLANPLCKHHRERGEVVPANEVDHEIPHRGDMTLFWDKSNWQGLCKPCHSRKTAQENGGFGNLRG